MLKDIVLSILGAAVILALLFLLYEVI